MIIWFRRGYLNGSDSGTITEEQSQSELADGTVAKSLVGCALRLGVILIVSLLDDNHAALLDARYDRFAEVDLQSATFLRFPYHELNGI